MQRNILDPNTNSPVDQRSFSVTGSTQCAVILPAELNRQFKLCGFEAISDKAGSALKVYEDDGNEAQVSNTAGTVAGLSVAYTGTAIPVDANGTQFQAGDIVVIVPMGWCSPNSDTVAIAKISPGLPPPFIGVPQMAVVAAGSTANAINTVAAVTVYPFATVYRMLPTVTRAIGAANVTWPAPGQPHSWWTTNPSKSNLILLDGTAACSIPYLYVETYTEPGNWLG